MAFGRKPAKSQVPRSTKNPPPPPPPPPRGPAIPAQANCTQSLDSQAQQSTNLASRPLPFRPHLGHITVSNNHTRNAPQPVACSSPSSGLEQSTSLIERREASEAVPESWQGRPTNHSNQNPTLRDLIASKFDTVITSIDSESFSGDEQELVIHEYPQPLLRGGWGSASREISKGANRAVSSAVTSTNYFTKANQYANSRLPPNLPPFDFHFSSYSLICLAAQYSQRAYIKPTGKEREAHVDANWRMGTKAMVIKSIPIDDMNTVVFAIRGSQTFMDWAVNLNSSPVSPSGFLDDAGNLCHSGFLSVARKMVNPVAARLRSLLEENPSCSGYSLLITGHSAGGAIASLLYAHMLAEEPGSELGFLAGCFRRIHCITFGTPPISLLPLTKPPTPRHRKSLFLSFINEGDPVPRADKAYVRSLLDLYTSPAPGTNCVANLLPSIPRPRLALKSPLRAYKRLNPPRPTSVPAKIEKPPLWVWRVPPGVLSNAGRLVVLRAIQNGNIGSEEDIKAEITTDAQLREVVFGDPVMHMMKVYARRVEVLATKAVTAKVWG